MVVWFLQGVAFKDLSKELITGGFAGGFAKMAVAPLERTKILLQTRRGDFSPLVCGDLWGRSYKMKESS